MLYAQASSDETRVSPSKELSSRISESVAYVESLSLVSEVECGTCGFTLEYRS